MNDIADYKPVSAVFLVWETKNRSDFRKKFPKNPNENNATINCTLWP